MLSLFRDAYEDGRHVSEASQEIHMSLLLVSIKGYGTWDPTSRNPCLCPLLSQTLM